MDLSTTYLGFQLPHPFVPGASPMTDELDMVRRLEDAGAPMLVLRSLFEEQIVGEQMAAYYATHQTSDSFPEALSYLPDPEAVAFGPHEYLEHVHRVRQAVNVPVVASINGTTQGAWLEYAKQIEQAGASALELNIYHLVTDGTRSSESIEGETLDMLEQVKRGVSLPVAAKLSPFYTSLTHLAVKIEQRQIDGLVLFNRFYQPDIDIEQLEVEPSLILSDSSELLLRLRWLAILSGKVRPDLCVTGGVHTAQDAIKAVMCGAHAVQMVSALLQNGPNYLRTIRQRVAAWLQDHEYESLAQMRGSMNLTKCPDPKAFERTNYMKVLQSWQGHS